MATPLWMLDIDTDAAARTATLRLSDRHGRFLAANDVRLDAHPVSCWEALFDTSRHVRRMEGKDSPAAALATKLGLFLGREVLGAGIMKHLAAGIRQRTLLIRLPDVSADPLAAAFARVPWELAQAEGDTQTLLQRQVVVRAALAGTEPDDEAPVSVAPGKPVRVLLIFAGAPGSRPLAMRLERERLLQLFYGEVFPKRYVEVDVLCHGVTRRRIWEQVRAKGGYHVVHWSGHGHHDLLEIALGPGEKALRHLSGAELVGLFQEAGGFIPSLVFLSACHSGSLLSAKDWASLHAALRDPDGMGAVKDSPMLEKIIAGKHGYTGTAIELLRAGIPQVVAMRYEVRDVYARRLARRFYRGLFADEAHHPVDGALAIARAELARDVERAAEYHAIDHATPLVLGSKPLRFVPPAKRSPQMDRRRPKPQPILLSGRKDLDAPHGFVGRGGVLAKLAEEWLSPGGAPIALIQGLAGLGKTALAAEAIHLWHGAFDYLLAFEARGGALKLEDLYLQIDQRLALASGVYRDRCDRNAMAKVYLKPSELSTGTDRDQVLRDNLIDVLHSERILLVLDNMEANLSQIEGPDGYPSSEPPWDRLFEALGDRLRGSGSRVLVTSRSRPAALAKPEAALWIPLGPLPMAEAILFFQGHRPLRELLYGDDEGKKLAQRILRISRGHALILDRIANLIKGPEGRAAVSAALDRIATTGYRALPDVFATQRTAAEQEQEQAYLEEVTVGWVDLLIGRLPPETRRLLWVVTRAGEPVAEAMLAGVWSGQSPEEQQMRQLASLLAMGDQLPQEIRAELARLPDEARAMLQSLSEQPGVEAPPLLPLLEQLCRAGLLVREEESGAYGFHELVAERATAWIAAHAEAQQGMTEPEIWRAYGEQYRAQFQVLLQSGKPGAHDLAAEAGRRGIRYLVRAGAFESLAGFAGAVVTGTRDPTLLGTMISDLQAAVAGAPPGQVRWRLRGTLADALDNAGRHDEALALYAQAVEEAVQAGDWAAVGWLCNNWASALRGAGQLKRAREIYMRSADAERQASRPKGLILGSELGALRIDVMQGHAGQALPRIQEKLAEVRTWWACLQRGEDVTEAGSKEDLARLFVSGLDIACQANLTLEEWQASLDLLDEMEQVKRNLGTGEHEIAVTRTNRYGPLVRLGKFGEAKEVLEHCLDVYRQVGDLQREAKALTALADVWDDLGDVAQAVDLERRALALCERLPNPGDRAISHANLANYLHKTGQTGQATEHQLAALTYFLVTGHDATVHLRNLAIRIRQAAARGERFDLPRLSDLLDQPAFSVLRAFLEEWRVSIPELEADIQEGIEAIRAQVTQEPSAG